MSTASRVSDAKTALRLRLRRLVVIDCDAARASAFAGALNRSGATAVAVSAPDAEHEAAHALDADVLLVNEDAPQACRPLVLALRQHPRTRWATVLPLSFSALWPRDADEPDTAVIADEVNRLASTLIELTVRAKGKLPHDSELEPLGPSRMLRALGNTGRSLRVSFTDARMSAELELGDGRIAGIRAAVAGAERVLSKAEALAEVLAMSSGQVRIEDRASAVLPAWNAALPAALEAAAAMTAWSPAPPDPDAGPDESGTRLAAVSVGEGAPQHAPDPPALVAHLQPTVPQISLADVLADASAMGLISNTDRPAAHAAHAAHAAAPEAPSVQAPAGEQASDAAAAEPAPEPPGAPEPSRPAGERPREARAQAAARARERPAAARARSPSRRAAVAFLSVAAVALAAALYIGPAELDALLRAGARPASGSRARAAAGQRPASALALAAKVVAAREAPPSTAAPAAGARAEPVAVAPPEPPGDAPAAPIAAPGEPSREQIARARRIARRGHRYLGAERYGRARTAYEKALAIAPSYVPAVKGLIRVHLHKGNAGEAVRWAEQLAALEPAHAASHLLLGDAHALSGDRDRAERAFSRAADLGSDAARKRLRRR